jgi:hypothetical protein
MGEIRSERPTCSESFIISQLAAIKSGVDRLQATNERHLVLTGQVLEAMRMGTPTAPPPKRSGLIAIWDRLHDLSKKFELAHKLWRVLVWSRVVLWPAYVIGGMKWLGWLG